MLAKERDPGYRLNRLTTDYSAGRGLGLPRLVSSRLILNDPNIEHTNMNRRTLLSIGGGTVLLGIGGCLDQLSGDPQDGNNTDEDPEEEFIPMEEIRDAACTPLPDGEKEITYTKAEYEHASLRIDAEDGTEDPHPFALIRTSEGADTRLNPEKDVDISGFIEETNFDEQALLVWDWSWNNTSETSEIIGVTQPDPETIHAYICQYGSAGGHASTEYAYLLRVDVPREPQQAKLIYREASGHEVEDGIETRKETYESK